MQNLKLHFASVIAIAVLSIWPPLVIAQSEWNEFSQDPSADYYQETFSNEWNSVDVYDGNLFTESTDEWSNIDYYDDLPHLRNATPLGMGLLWSDRRSTIDVLPGSNDDLGLVTVSSQSKISSEAIPFASITPRFRRQYLDGPSVTDAADQLYDATLSFSVFCPLSFSWTLMGQAGVGYFSDLEQSDSDAWRFPAEAVLFYTQRSGQFYAEQSAFSWAIGVSYLDREDIKVLPVFGMLYSSPNDGRFQAELVFPRPKLKWLVSDNGLVQRTVFIQGELGGGSWSVERRGTFEHDILSLRDYRLSVGFENLLNERTAWSIEAGYVFGRRLEYSSHERYDFDDTALIRVGLLF